MPTDCIFYLWIHPHALELGTIVRVKDFVTMKPIYDKGYHGGDLITLLPIRGVSHKYSLQQLELMQIYKKLTMLDLGISDLTLTARRAVADNMFKAQKRRITVTTLEVAIAPKFDKIVYIDSILKDTHITQHPIDLHVEGSLDSPGVL